MPSLACACYSSEQQALQRAVGVHGPAPRAVAAEQHAAVNIASTLYMLNPSGDLPTTQAAFQALFAGQQTWQVSGCTCFQPIAWQTSGCPPSVA